MNKHNVLKKHFFIIVGLSIILLVWKCPSLYFFGIPCPGCGITRAHFSALHLDFAGAFYYHPLFFLALPCFLYVSHRRILKHRLPKTIETILVILFIILVFGVYFYRLFASKSPVVAFQIQDSAAYRLLHFLQS